MFPYIAALPATTNGQVDLTSFCPNLVTDAITCVQASITETAISSLVTDPQVLLDVDGLVINNAALICQAANTPQLKALYDCVFAKLILCLPAAWQLLYPSLPQVQQTIDSICQNVQNINLTCVEEPSRSAAVGACVMQGTPPTTPSPADPVATVAFQCSQTDLSVTCTATAYATCPGNTAGILSLAVKLQSPSGCATGDMVRPALTLVLIPVAACVMSLLTKVLK
ncbi:uncharacterized protein LOC124290348 [Haliotis rubra]|uniref:uncharacterized protein LOC124290348 n=1 Tax=Haliotis rubra TaxID=36100 RepID=UPI001EE60B4E|nr:uncharacterized protein LOC124290348 [Haliotis rubra]